MFICTMKTEEACRLSDELCACACVCTRPGALALQISCFSEAERIYMLAKDTTINNKALTPLVIPEIQVRLT